MIRFAMICVLAFPVVVLGSLLAFIVFGPVDIPPGIALVIAASIVVLAAYTAKLGRDNR